MKKIYTLAIILASSIFSAKAQMLADFAQFNTNLTYYNPAYAGLDESALNASLLTRYDWFGITGSPFTNSCTIDKRIDSKKLGLSANFINYNYGNYKLFDLYGNAAYHLDLGGEKKLSFGIKGGFSNTYVYQANILNKEDAIFNKTDDFVSAIIPKLGLGFAFKAENFHLSAALPDAIGYDNNGYLLKKEKGNRSFFDQKNVIFNGYYKLAINEDYHFIPSLLLRISPSSLPKTDISLSVGKTEAFWAGLVVSPNNSIRKDGVSYPFLNNGGLTGGMYINGRLKLGGAFLYNFNIESVYKTSAEISLTYDLEDVF